MGGPVWCGLQDRGAGLGPQGRARPAHAFPIKGQMVKMLGFLPTAWGGTEAATLHA